MEALPRQAAAITEIAGQDARARHLEQLYAVNGRHDPKHPRHGHYTGLFMAQQAPAAEGVS